MADFKIKNNLVVTGSATINGVDVVTTSATQTLTNKTLTSPVISTISNTGTLTLPTSTDTLVGRATTDTLTNKTIDAASNTISNIANSNVSASAAIALSKLAALTASRALASDGSGVITASSVTSTELGYLSGVTSAIQTQLGDKANVTLSNLGTTAINADLLFDTDNLYNLGSSSAIVSLAFINAISHTSGSTAIDVGERQIMDKSGNATIDADLKQLQSGGQLKLDWSASTLKTGATTKLDWSGTDLSVNTRKITGLAAGTTSGDAVRYEQAVLITGANAFTADQSMGGFKITSLAAPSASSDAATKGYVDSVAEGLKPKAAVRVASTANVVIATALENGDTLDGVTLATGNRVLLKDQTAPEENGIYVVVASGAASRSTDFDSLTPIDEINGAIVAVQEGTANAGKIFVQQGTVATLGTDPINFVFFNSSSALVGGDGITVSGSNVSVDHDGEGLQFVSTQLALELDGSTLSKSSTGLKVATGGITNTEVSGSAAIAYSKLDLATSIVNADVATGAAIARSKLASGTADHVLINDGSGVMSSEAALAISRGGTNNSTAYTAGSVIFSNGTQLTENNSGLFFDNSNIRLGVGFASPNFNLSFNANSGDKTVGIERPTSTPTAANLTIRASSPQLGTTDGNGGNVTIRAGNSTGSGTSRISFSTATAGTSGTTDRNATQKAFIDGAGNLVVGVGSALSTSATGGFVQISATAGVPAGTVSVTTGSAPLTVDTTNNDLYFYSGSWIKALKTVSLTSDVTGVLPIANGGTNSSAALNNDRIMVSSAGTITEAAALSNGALLIGSTGSSPVAATITAGSGISVTNGAGSITIANTQVSATDIPDTQFNFTNNQGSAANVTGLAFANASVRSFKALVSVFRDGTANLYEAFELIGIQKDSSWDLAQTSTGDNSGVVFTITTAGQIQYTSTDNTGSSAEKMRFRAITTAIES